MENLKYLSCKANLFQVEIFYGDYRHIYLLVVNRQAHGLQMPNEGINQRNSKGIGQILVADKYALAVHI